MMKHAFAILMLMAGLAACQGQTSTEPPIHLNPNMDQQARYDPQEPNEMFADKRSARPFVEGVVAHGFPKTSSHYWHGKVNGELATTLPGEIPLTDNLLARGRERYNIYCTPCHDAAGTGRGTVVQRKVGMTLPSNFHDDRLRAMPVGHFYDVISNGVRTMSSYAAQIPVEDRWAIAAYIRALQVSKAARLEDVPPELASAKGWK